MSQPKPTLHTRVMASLNRNGFVDADGQFYTAYARTVVSHVLRMARREAKAQADRESVTHWRTPARRGLRGTR